MTSERVPVPGFIQPTHPITTMTIVKIAILATASAAALVAASCCPSAAPEPTKPTYQAPAK